MSLILALTLATVLVLLLCLPRSGRTAAGGNGAEAEPLALRIDMLLPQTQCGQCGYPGCLPYARAMARGQADINQCPPGGPDTITALAALLHRPVKPLNPENGVHKPKRLALIDESRCIGCTKCIQACPVDAIVGASKLMHTVIAGACTGCELCIPPCPVDCIELVEPPGPLSGFRVAPPAALVP